ncbi:ATP-binding cassette domain-containing protein [Blastococcus sp. SYSU D00820]
MTPHAAPAVRLAALVADADGVRVLDGVDLTVPRGTVHAVLAPGGTEGCTLLRVLAGELAPVTGRAQVLGRDVGSADGGRGARIALTGRPLVLDERRSGAEHLRLRAELLGFSRPGAHRRAQQLLLALGLDDLGTEPVRRYDAAARRCLDLALGLVLRPDLLLAGEPTLGLPVPVRDQVTELFGALARAGTAVLTATRCPAEAGRGADRVTVLAGGRVVPETVPRRCSPVAQPR